MSAPKLQRSFQRIDNTEIYVSYPRKEDVEKGGRAPRLIIILGWMEAPLSQVYRFTEMYHQIYPSAIQILIRIVIKALFSELHTNKPPVLPVVKLLHDAGIKAYDPPESSGLLVHTFSTGGAMSQSYLAHCLADTRPAPFPGASALPAQALIYDSVPSTLSFSVFSQFFTTGVTSPVLRAAAKPLLASAYAGTVAYKYLFDPRPDTFTISRGDMNDEKMMPQTVPQLYVYGDADMLTPPESVENFVAEKKERLRKEGVEVDRVVMVEKYEGSPHVSHAKSDAKRYASAIVRTWEASYRNGGVGESRAARCKL